MLDKKQSKIAPEFSVSDSKGLAVRLSDYRGKKTVMLVFNRGFT
jgi:peroxiredoxin